MFKTILVPIDMAHAAEGKANIELAAQHAAAGAKIILLNVVEEIPTWAAAELPANLIPDSMSRAKEELGAIANATGQKLEVEVRNGRSYRTILEVAEEKDRKSVV